MYKKGWKVCIFVGLYLLHLKVMGIDHFISLTQKMHAIKIKPSSEDSMVFFGFKNNVSYECFFEGQIELGKTSLVLHTNDPTFVIQVQDTLYRLMIQTPKEFSAIHQVKLQITNPTKVVQEVKLNCNENPKNVNMSNKGPNKLKDFDKQWKEVEDILNLLGSGDYQNLNALLSPRAVNRENTAHSNDFDEHKTKKLESLLERIQTALSANKSSHDKTELLNQLIEEAHPYIQEQGRSDLSKNKHYSNLIRKLRLYVTSMQNLILQIKPNKSVKSITSNGV